MTMPELDRNGLLPAGVHDCSWDDINSRFGRFQKSDRRMRLCRRLQEFLDEARKTELIAFVIVNGSFVTDKDEPEDIDLVLVLRRDHDFSAELRPFQYNILSKRQVRRRYQFDVLVARENSLEYDEYVGFFQQVRGLPNRSKGILKVLL